MMENGSLRRKVFRMTISGIFILAVATVSVFLFCRRDILIYDDKYGYLSVLALCFICNATVFAPAPSLIVAITAAQSLQPLPVVLLGAIGTTLGEMVGFVSGTLGRNFTNKEGRINSWILNHGIIAVFLFALLPLPLFDLAGIVSGYSKMKWHRFALVCFGGKLLKMTIYVFGSLFLEQRLGISF